MKFIFICPGLEPARDGVGDYSRAQAAGFVRLGHSVLLLALNDGQISERVDELQVHEEHKLVTLRLPKSWNWDRKVKAARQWLISHDPEWIMFQFAPYAFGEKGVPFSLMLQASKLFRGYKVFIMMHELWLGGVKNGPWKHRLVGLYVQRPVIAMLVKSVRPLVVATSNPLYKIVLRSGGINARLLPIPSSIPISQSGRSEVDMELQQAGLADVSRYLLLGVFGEIHAGGDYVGTLSPVIEEAEQKGRQAILFFIGRNGRNAESLCDVLGNAFGRRLIIRSLGMRSAAFISAFLTRLDYGMATSPRPLLGKSSSVAAYRRHGLKILVPYEWSIPEHRRFLALAGPAFDRASPKYADPAVVCARILRLTASNPF